MIMTRKNLSPNTTTINPNRKAWQLCFKGRIEDFDPSDSIVYWQGKSDLEKFNAVTELIHEAQVIKGRLNYDAPSLLRSTAVLKRI